MTQPSIIRHRIYWALFLGSLSALSLMIRAHVKGLNTEIRREGLANVAVITGGKTLVDHLDIEVGLRGYLLAGTREYLQPYHEALGRVSRDMDTLRAALEPYPDEHADSEQIASLSRSILSEFSNQISMVELAGIDAARKRFVDYPTKPAMDQIRHHVAAILAIESRRLAANTQALDRSTATVVTLIDVFAAVSTLLSAAMGLGIIWPPAGPYPEHAVPGGS